MADGSNGERKPITSTLQMTFEHDTFSLHIAGEAPSIDVFLTMIEQARRHFEAQLRAQAAMQLQQQLADKVKTNNIINRLGGKA